MSKYKHEQSPQEWAKGISDNLGLFEDEDDLEDKVWDYAYEHGGSEYINFNGIGYLDTNEWESCIELCCGVGAVKATYRNRPIVFTFSFGH